MTKRPLATIGLTYLIVLAVAVCLASIINLTFAIMAALIGIAATFIMRDYRTQVLLITIPLSLGFGVMWSCQNNAENMFHPLHVYGHSQFLDCLHLHCFYELRKTTKLNYSMS